MKKITTTMRLSFKSFLEVYRFNPLSVTLSLSVLLFGVIRSYFELIISKGIVDNLFSGMYKSFYIYLIILVSLQMIANVLNYVSLMRGVRLTNEFLERTDFELINSLKRINLMTKEHPKFHSDFSYQRFASRKTYELYSQLIQFIFKAMTLAIGIHYLINIDILFVIMALICSLITGAIHLIPIKSKARLGEESERVAVKNAYLFELISGIKNQREMMVYRIFDYFREKWIREKRNYNHLQLKLTGINNKESFANEFVSIIFNASVLIIIALLMDNKNFTLGSYVSITMAIGLTVGNLSALIQQYAIMSENGYHLIKRLNFQNESLQQKKHWDDGTMDFSLQNEIEISKLSFSYPNSDRAALHDINFTIKKGETIVILGENGSGKSTLLKFILGLYESEMGCVKIDGVPIQRFDKESIFNKSSVIFQDYIQYQTTVRDNIAVGNIEQYQNDNKLKTALEYVGINKIITDLDKKVGFIDEDAINLSGGQWQRLALSRFYYKDNIELAVFDEATSSLDPLAEVKMFNDIFTYCQSITTVIISHRVGVARRADKIMVMKNGTILEQGTHHELIKEGGYYYEMWISQKEWYQDNKEVNVAVHS
ncbi:putative multidrug resistance ABC transporter ATP-binding/permease protein YheI [compost metagenome]